MRPISSMGISTNSRLSLDGVKDSALISQFSCLMKKTQSNYTEEEEPMTDILHMALFWLSRRFKSKEFRFQVHLS